MFFSLYCLIPALVAKESLISCLLFWLRTVSCLAISFLTTLILASFEATPEATLFTLSSASCSLWSLRILYNSSVVMLRSLNALFYLEFMIFIIFILLIIHGYLLKNGENCGKSGLASLRWLSTFEGIWKSRILVYSKRTFWWVPALLSFACLRRSWFLRKFIFD